MDIRLTIVNQTGRQLTLDQIQKSANAQWSPTVRDTGQILEVDMTLETTLAGPDASAFNGALMFACDELEGATFSVVVVRPTRNGINQVWGLGQQSPGGPFVLDVEGAPDAGNWNVLATAKLDLVAPPA